MPTVSAEKLAGEIHAGPLRLVIAATGGGSGAISTLLGVSGASRSVLAAVVPYAPAALCEWLGVEPAEFCSPWTARAMAMTAYLRAASYDPAARTCGVACTASLATDRPKRGEHRAHLAYQTVDATAAISLILEKGRRTRAEEEALVTALILNHIAEACGVEDRVRTMLFERELIQARSIVAPPDQQDLLAGRTRAILLGPAGKRIPPRALFPGAFHPLHGGHQKMAEVARQILGTEIAYEMSIANVDKPPLDFLEIDHRARQFTDDEKVWLTWAPNFTDKAELFPGATFIVGADTIIRVGDPRYYGDQPSVRDAAIDKIAAAGCRFLVFGRTVRGEFCTLSTLKLPEPLSRLCQEMPAELFRDDISSTQLRQQQSDES